MRCRKIQETLSFVVIVSTWPQKGHSVNETIRPFDEYFIKTKLVPVEGTKLFIESISQKTLNTLRLGNGRIAFTPQSQLSPIPFPVKPKAIQKAENHGNTRRLKYQALKTAGPEAGKIKHDLVKRLQDARFKEMGLSFDG
ncbi:hypothetical protein OAG11_05240 [Verrucomicrobia bacterium]|nr:hypothetical protein [Verrucomicrobiota bacterium]